MRHFAAVASVLAALSLGLAAPAMAAAPCKDSKGKFIKCPPVAAKVTTKVMTRKVVVVKKGPCRDSKGKFIKCK